MKEKSYNRLTVMESSNGILELLAASSEPVTYQQIEQETGLKSPKTALSKLKSKGMVDNIGRNQWVITNEGRELLRKQHEKPAIAVRYEVPLSLEDTFHEVGRRLYFSKQKSRLDSIMYYVSRVCNLTDANSIWNALTDFKLTPRVKYTWIKLYFATICPGLRLPTEFEETRYQFLNEEDEIS